MLAMSVERLRIALLLCCLGACKEPPSGAPPPVEHKEDGGHHPGLPSRVQLSAEVIQAAGVRTAVVREERLSAMVEIAGEVMADPDRTARVAARLVGRVVSVHVREGARVAAGTLLCVLESPELLRTRASLLTAQARGRSASENADRLNSLAGSGAASKQEATAAMAELLALRAEAQAAEQTLKTWGLMGRELGGETSARLEVRAPIEGFVTSRNATVGQAVTSEYVLFELVNLDEAYFVGRLFEKSLARVQVGDAATVRLNAYPEAVFAGSVESIGKQLDPLARTVVARIRIKNQADRLKVGLFGTALVVDTEPSPAESHIVVPVSALIRINEQDIVFVRRPEGDFEARPVMLGRTAAGHAEVLSGLRAGEQAVVEGAFTLKSTMLRSTLGED
jgi:cobalt-zinc-cadmium efflux system membrane fusion protein